MIIEQPKSSSEKDLYEWAKHLCEILNMEDESNGNKDSERRR
jgi:hypothetical protein